MGGRGEEEKMMRREEKGEREGGRDKEIRREGG